MFVTNGTLYNSTGWVQTETVGVVGTDAIAWAQFSGAGTYTAGAALRLDGTQFNLNVGNGLAVSGANAAELAASAAGDGLTYSAGVLAVGGTDDRITVSANAADIASTYAGQSSITTVGTITSGTWQGDTIATAKGGTGLTSYATGDMLFASAADTLSKLAAGAEGAVLQINASGVPMWGALDGGTY